MGLAFDIHDSALCFRATGDVQYVDGLQIMCDGFAAAEKADPAKKWDLLFDLSESDENRSSDELRGVAAEIAKYTSMLSTKVAVVATNPLYFGLSRMFGVYMQGEGFESMVFTSSEEAHAWLKTIRDSDNTA